MKLINRFKEENYTLPGKITTKFIDAPLIKMTGQKETEYIEKDVSSFIEKDFLGNIDKAVYRICMVYHNIRESSVNRNN